MRNSYAIIAMVVVGVIVGGSVYGVMASIPPVTSTITITPTGSTSAIVTTSTTTTTTSQATNVVKYNVGTILLSADSGWAAIDIGNSANLWPQGATVTSISGNTGANVQALASGTIQMSIAAVSGLVAGICANATYKIVAVWLQNNTAESLYVPANSSYTSVTDLHGKTFGVTRVGSLSDQVTRYYLGTLGWKEGTDYFVTGLGTEKAELAAAESGSIAGFFTGYYEFQPFVSQGLVKRLANLTLPGPLVGVAATSNFIQSHPDTIKSFLQSLYNVGSIYNNNQTLALNLLQNGYNYSQTEALGYYNTHHYSTNGFINSTAMQQAADFDAIGGSCPTGFNASSTYVSTFAPTGS